MKTNHSTCFLRHSSMVRSVLKDNKFSERYRKMFARMLVVK